MLDGLVKRLFDLTMVPFRDYDGFLSRADLIFYGKLSSGSSYRGAAR